MRLIYILGVILLTVSCSDSKSDKHFDNSSKNNKQSANIEQGIFVVPDVPDSVTFAGEIIPLADVDLKERFDRELVVNNFWHSNTILFLKRANRWFPMIKEVFHEEGVPQDLIYISVVESGLRQVTSPAGAKGFWQFMKPTAKEYGLKINHEVDERLNVKKSTISACQYLKRAYEELGSWTLAAASYNRGVRGVRNALDHQEVDSYFDLSLNEETSRYVFRILAIKEIMTFPQKYGFKIEAEQLYPVYAAEVVRIDQAIISLVDWAKKQGTTLKVIRRLNPWILRNKLSVNKQDEFTILIPENNEQLGKF
jgi:hypothetical protein